MADIARLQDGILQHLSSTGEPAVPSDALCRSLRETPTRISEAVRGLIQAGKVTITKGTTIGSSSGNGEGGGQAAIYVSLAAGTDLGENAHLVYKAIHASGASGVDQQQLASRLRMPKSDILKALKSLTQQLKIKEERSFSNRAKKVYLLFHLQPSAQVTGGTLYCGEDLDTAFVDDLRQRIVFFVSRYRSVSLGQIESELLSEESTIGNIHSSSSGSGGGPAAVVKTEPRDDGGGVNDDDMSFDFDRLPPLTGTAGGGNSGDSGGGCGYGEENEQRPGSPIAFIHSSGSAGSSRLGAPSPFPSQPLPPAGAASTAGARTVPLTNPQHQQQYGVAGGRAVPLPPPGQPTSGGKRVQSKDIKALVLTLVLDGVLEQMVSPAELPFAAMTQPNQWSGSGGGPSSASSVYAPPSVPSFYEPSRSMLGGSAATPAETQLRLATGANVMRHFTATAVGPASAPRVPPPGRKRPRGGAIGCGREENDRDNANESNNSGGGGGGMTAESVRRARLGALHQAMIDECLYGPADVSKPTSSLSSLHAGGGEALVAASSRGGVWAYMPAVGFPCLGCPLLANCSAAGKGITNMQDCSYLKEWLQ